MSTNTPKNPLLELAAQWGKVEQYTAGNGAVRTRITFDVAERLGYFADRWAALAAAEAMPAKTGWRDPSTGLVWSEAEVRWKGTDTTGWEKVVAAEAQAVAGKEKISVSFIPISEQLPDLIADRSSSSGIWISPPVYLLLQDGSINSSRLMVRGRRRKPGEEVARLHGEWINGLSEYHSNSVKNLAVVGWAYREDVRVTATSKATVVESDRQCMVAIDNRQFDVVSAYRAHGFKVLPPELTMSGGDLKRLAGVPGEYALVRQSDQKSIREAETIIVHPGDEFDSVPPAFSR